MADALRILRTKLHNQFGVFRYADELRRHGKFSPSEQIVLIARFIEERLGKTRDLPPAGDDERVALWMREGITNLLPTLPERTDSIDNLPVMLLRTERVIAWNPYGDFAELLNYSCGRKAYEHAASQLRSKGFDIWLLDTCALAEQFVSLRLPTAVRSFDLGRGRGREEAWLTTVFYRFALNQLISDRHNRRIIEDFAVKESKTPDTVLGREIERGVLQQLPCALAKLPPKSRVVIERYFGFDGRERTVAEIGSELGISQYLTRGVLVQGIASLAALLNVSGPLSRQEFELVKLTFRDGMPLNKAAEALKVSPKEVRVLCGKVGQKFRRVLRLRTTSPLYYPGKRDDEMSLGTEIRILSNTEIAELLRRLSAEPSISQSASGVFEVKLEDHWIPVARVREALNSDQRLSDELLDKRAPIGWIALPDPRMDRADQLDDAQAWAIALDSLHGRSWDRAAALYRLCSDVDSEFGRHEIEDHTIERIHRTLGSIVSTLEIALPFSLRRSRAARLRVWRPNDFEVLAQWDQASYDADSTTINLLDLSFDSARLVGNMEPCVASTLAKTIVKELFEAEFTFSGFTKGLESTAQDVVWLHWIPPTLEPEP